MRKRFLAKLISFTMAIVLMFPAVNTSAAQSSEAKTNGNEKFVFNVGAKSERGLSGFFPLGVNVSPKSVQGKQAYTLEAKGDTNKKTVYFSVDNTKLTQDIMNGRGVEVTVEYLDNGSGIFSLVYDDIYDEIQDTKYEWTEIVRNHARNWTDVDGKYAGAVYLNDTKVWKTHTFYIRDARFLKRLPNRSDFYISLNNKFSGNSEGDVSIASVSIKAMDTKSPARIWSSTDSVGSIFFADADVSFNTDIISTVNYDFEGEAVYSAININDVGTRYDKTIEPMRLERDGTLDSSLILEQKREHISLKAGETINKTVKFDNVKNFGCMTYRVELIDDKNGLYTVYDKPFSRVVRTKDEPLNQNLGMSMHYFNNRATVNAYADTGFDLLERMGISWIRGNVNWPNIETKRHNYALDKGTESFFKRNMEKYGGKFHMYPILGDNNSLLGDGKEYTYENFGSKKATDAFGEFAEACAELMKPYGVDTLEIINEPNLSKVLKPDIYAGVLESVYRIVKEDYPNVKIAGPTVAEIPVTSETDYIPELFKKGGLKNIDIVSVHPYNWRFAPEFAGNIEKINKLRELCKEYGKPNVPIWATETGYPTATKNQQIREAGNDTGVLAQAQWMSRSIIINISEHILDKIFLYTLHDGADPTNTEARFGICTGFESYYEPFTAKPALVAVSNASHMMNEAECTDKIIADERASSVYRYSRKGKDDMIALWTSKDREELSLSLGAKEITVTDMYGNEEKRYSPDGVYDFMLSGDVMYLTGKFTDFKKVEPRIKNDNSILSAVPGDTYEFSLNNNTGLPLTVKAQGGAGTEITAAPVFNENNKAVGAFKLKTSAESEIKLSFYNGDKLYATESYKVVPADRVEFEVENVEAYNENTLNRWYVSVLISNKGNERPVGGYIKLQSPANIAGGISSIPVGEILPGKQRRVIFYLPEMNKKYKDALVGIFYMNDGSEQYMSVDIDFTIAKYTDNPPIIDGVIENGEWTKGAWIFMDKATQIRQIKDWKGTEDLSGRVNIMWDNENLYLATVVTDDVLDTSWTDPSGAWRNDSLQIALKCDMNSEAYAFNEMCLAMINGESLIYRHKAEGTAQVGLVTNFKGKIVRDEDQKTTTYEFAIPWSELVKEGFKVKPGISIAFSMLINDNDGSGRRGWIELTPGIGYEKDPRMFTKITLMK